MKIKDPFALDEPKVGPRIRNPNCMARGCPCHASVYDSVTREPTDGLCRYHAFNESRHWPRITEVLRAGPLEDHMLEPRMTGAGFTFQPTGKPGPKLEIVSGTSAEIAAYHMARIAEIRTKPQPGPKAWAHKLMGRETAGEQLLSAQCSAWRTALGIKDLPETEGQREAREERLGMQEGA